MPQGATQEVKAGCRQQDLGHTPFLGFVGGVLWSSWARAGLANSHQKKGVLVNFLGVLPKEHKGEGPGRWRDLITRALGEVVLGICICL